MKNRKRLGDLLLEAGLITNEQLEYTLKHKKEGQKLGDALVENEFISEYQLIEVLEFQLGIPHVTLHRFPIDPDLIKYISKDYAKRNLVFPIKKQDRELTVAMNDPMDYFTIDELSMSTGFKIRPVIATKEEIINAIYKFYDKEEYLTGEIGVFVENEGESDAPAVKLVNQILAAGIHLKASDIHLDPHANNVSVRYRIDGELRTERVITKLMYPSVVARIKILGNLNITETRLPQDGRIKIDVEQTKVDLRISILPTVHGEKVVIRILDLENVFKEITQLGFSDDNLNKFRHLIHNTGGLILITGPTGSGKTSTLYAALQHLNKESVNIITVEDPVEYELEGINQVQVNPQIGLTFANGLRSILRQDPNIIMIGEIRDEETAEIAIRASLTGHLVLSTLHTNSAISAIPRLLDMGLPPYLVISSLTGVVGQRLVRKICTDCIESYKPTEMEKQIFLQRGLQVETLYRGKGCNRCFHSGYKGRQAIHEVLVLTPEIKSLLSENQKSDALLQYCQEKGMKFLLDDGLLKAMDGVTTVDEVLRVISHI